MAFTQLQIYSLLIVKKSKSIPKDVESVGAQSEKRNHTVTRTGSLIWRFVIYNRRLEYQGIEYEDLKRTLNNMGIGDIMSIHYA